MNSSEHAKGLKRSLELMFAVPMNSGNLNFPDDDFLNSFYGIACSLNCNNELVVGYINNLSLKYDELSWLKEFNLRLFKRFVDYSILPEELLNYEKWGKNTQYLLDLSWKILANIANIIEVIPNNYKEEILPSTFDNLIEFSTSFSKIKDTKELAQEIASLDIFKYFRSFRYSGITFEPINPDSIKDINKFYGFLGVRSIFKHHFKRFADEGTNLPLFINSLPGYGKTSMAMSYVLAFENLTLILAEPQILESNWSNMMNILSKRSDHKFVVFFDDIDPQKIDWYNFRTNVGGAFSPPPNVMIMLSANYQFPTNVLSRGRKVSFPDFDEIRCLEMVEDFLINFGLRKPSRNLVTLIAADYTEEFGQKKFTELSPRSLTRYLKIYETNKIKRKTMVELSFGELITKPDGQLFYEFNIELMRSLYGDKYIEKLLKQKLRNLEE